VGIHDARTVIQRTLFAAALTTLGCAVLLGQARSTSTPVNPTNSPDGRWTANTNGAGPWTFEFKSQNSATKATLTIEWDFDRDDRDRADIEARDPGVRFEPRNAASIISDALVIVQRKISTEPTSCFKVSRKDRLALQTALGAWQRRKR